MRHARTKSCEEFVEILGRWNAFGDPRGAASRHDDAHQQRDANVFERNGVMHLRANGGTMQGAAMIEIFLRQCEAEFLADWEAARAAAAAAGDTVDPMTLMARTDAQRRFDALHSLFLGAVASPPGSVAPEPVVNIVITVEEYERRLADLATGRHADPATADDVDRQRCETDTGIQIDPLDAVMASMTGWFRRVIVDSAGVVIDLGRKRRFTGSARVAVILSRRRCLWPGCGRASSRNQIDHTHEHSRGGLTMPHNAGPACGRHNRAKNRGFTVHRDANGDWHVYRPDGTELIEPAAA
jgi:hypothetical protein